MKLKNSILMIAVIGSGTLIIQNSCKKDKAQPISSSSTVVITTGLCDTISYTKHIAPIVLSCGQSGCHDASPRHIITNYTQLKSEVSSGYVTISSTNNHVLGNSKDMTLQAGLTSSQNAWMKCWIDKGMPQ